VVNIAGYGDLNSSALAGGTPPLSFVSIPSKATWPYMQQWHLDVQHDLGKNTVATLSYVGSAGVHLTRSYEYNQMHAVPAGKIPMRRASQSIPHSTAVGVREMRSPMWWLMLTVFYQCRKFLRHARAL